MIIKNHVTAANGLGFGGGLTIGTASSATISGSAISNNISDLYGGGIFMDGGATISMSGSQIYGNKAQPNGGGGVFVGGSGVSSGTIQNTIIASNDSYQIAEHKCPSITLAYLNNSIVGAVFTGSCGVQEATVAGFNNFSASDQTSGNTTNAPNVAMLLAVPSSDGPSTLAWSVAGATSVTISGVGTIAAATDTRDLAPGVTTNYSLTASSPGGSIGPVTAVGRRGDVLGSGVVRRHARAGRLRRRR